MDATQVIIYILKNIPETSLDSVIDTLKDHINAKDKDGDTPLILACFKKLESVAMKLIEKNADVNAKDNCGNTPLIWACCNKLESVAMKLIEKNAYVNAKNNAGGSSLDYIRGRWDTDAEKRILDLILLQRPVISNPISAEQTEIKPVQPEIKSVKSYPVGMLNIPYLIENNITFTHENGQITLL